MRIPRTSLFNSMTRYQISLSELVDISSLAASKEDSGLVHPQVPGMTGRPGCYDLCKSISDHKRQKECYETCVSQY